MTDFFLKHGSLAICFSDFLPQALWPNSLLTPLMIKSSNMLLFGGVRCKTDLTNQLEAGKSAVNLLSPPGGTGILTGPACRSIYDAEL